jgi:MYXO-CTERM domain-containing protein
LRLPFGPRSRHLNSQTPRPPCRSVRIMLPFCIISSRPQMRKIAHDLQAQFRRRLSTGMAKSATNREKLLLSCGDLQKQHAKLRLVVGAYLLGRKLLRGHGVFLRLYLVPLRQNLAPGPIHSRSLRMCACATSPRSSAWPKGGLALMGICRVARPKSRR